MWNWLVARFQKQEQKEAPGKLLWPRGKGNVPGILTVRDDGFELSAGSVGRQWVPWISVTSVAAYKYDLFAVDEVVLAFETRDRPDLAIEVSEECPGFGDLFKPLERELGIAPDGYHDVMHPAFATNYRVIFERPAPARHRDHFAVDKLERAPGRR